MPLRHMSSPFRLALGPAAVPSWSCQRAPAAPRLPSLCQWAGEVAKGSSWAQVRQVRRGGPGPGLSPTSPKIAARAFGPFLPTARHLVGARLLALQLSDGQWAGGIPTFTSSAAANWWESLPPDRRGTFFPEWTSTAWSLTLLRDFGLDPKSPRARHAVALVRDNCRWEHDGEPFFSGEVEPCINGRAVATGAYFGEHVQAIVDRLLGEQMSDGGWNCEQENGATRGSFHTTIEVLAGLLQYELATGGSPEVRAAQPGLGNHPAAGPP